MPLSPVAQALAKALLKHRRHVVKQHPPGLKGAVIESLYVINYGLLCRKAGVPGYTRRAGFVLQEIAEWCAQNGTPPLNALAVNKKAGHPGGGYDGAGGFLMKDWPKDLARCARYTKYPRKRLL